MGRQLETCGLSPGLGLELSVGNRVDFQVPEVGGRRSSRLADREAVFSASVHCAIC